MTQLNDVLKALNQLTSLVVGKDNAIATNHLANEPAERINDLIGTVADQLAKAATEGNPKAMKQAQRQLESLGSLKTLSTVLLDETEWEE